MYHVCGQEIIVDSRFNGLVSIVIFYDENGREITHCPGCGESVTAWLHPEGNGGVLRLEPGALLDEVANCKQ